MTKPSRPSLFTRFSRQTSYYSGKPGAFVLAVVIILAWAASGPLFGYSDTWQLVINTSTTIITFLMVFVIQNSQNRDTAALQIKIDELILKLEGPRDALIDLEDLDDDEIDKLRSEMSDVALKARGENERAAGKDKAGKREAGKTTASKNTASKGEAGKNGGGNPRTNRNGAGKNDTGKNGAAVVRQLSRAAAGKPPARRTGSRTTKAP